MQPKSVIFPLTGTENNSSKLILELEMQLHKTERTEAVTKCRKV